MMPDSRHPYHFDEIGKLELGIGTLLKELRPYLLNDEYGCILGDDTSGRIPALVLSRAINLYRTRNGLPKLPVYFIQGASSDEELPALEAAYSRRKASLKRSSGDRRILVATEGLTSGSSIARLGQLLQRDGMTFDLAVLDGQRFTRDSSTISVPTSITQKMARTFTYVNGTLSNPGGTLSQSPARTLTTPTPSLGHALSTLSGSRGNIVPLTAPAAARKRTARKHEMLQAVPSDPDRGNFLLDPTDDVGWPVSTRLFVGLHWAGEFRDRPDLTGLKTEKFPVSPVIHGDPAVRASVGHAREDVAHLAQQLATSLEYSNTAIPRMRKSVKKLLHEMRGHVQRDDIAFILGDDTSGRVPTLLIAHSINAYRATKGLPKLPVFFCEGTRDSNDVEQIRAFTPIAKRIACLDSSKKALIVTDNIGSGASCMSLIERVGSQGFAAIAATFGGVSSRSLQSFTRNSRWPDTTIAYSGEGDPSMLIDKVELSGLTQRRPKFSPGLVADDAYTRWMMRGIRGDIRHIIADLTPALVPEVVQLDPVLDELVELLLPIMDALKRDTLIDAQQDTYRRTQPYGGIVVEDPVGRLPGLLVRQVINAWRKEQGLPPIPIVFLPIPAGAADPSALSTALAPLDRMVKGMTPNTRLLVVSGELRAGNVIKHINDHLAGTGIPFNVLPIGGKKHARHQYLRSGIIPQETLLYQTPSISPQLDKALRSRKTAGIAASGGASSACSNTPARRQSVNSVRHLLPAAAKYLLDSQSL